jgi:hypothetical protein
VLSGPERRRRRTKAEKVRLVEETLTPEAKIAEVARRHECTPICSMHGGGKRGWVFWPAGLR